MVLHSADDRSATSMPVWIRAVQINAFSCQLADEMIRAYHLCQLAFVVAYDQLQLAFSCQLDPRIPSFLRHTRMPAVIGGGATGKLRVADRFMNKQLEVSVDQMKSRLEDTRRACALPKVSKRDVCRYVSPTRSKLAGSGWYRRTVVGGDFYRNGGALPTGGSRYEELPGKLSGATRASVPGTPSPSGALEARLGRDADQGTGSCVRREGNGRC